MRCRIRKSITRPGARPKARLIVTADDFGRSSEINAAVIRAHHEGLLTSASLMVAGEAAQEAVDLAKHHPSLAVGLHLTVTDGRPALPPAQVPHLVNTGGHFPSAPTVCGLRYFFLPAARRELAAELEAQFAAFAATGLSLSHVDGHQHMHMHPTIFRLLVPLAVRNGARAVRVPHDDLRLANAHDRKHRWSKWAAAATFALLARNANRRLAGTGLIAPQRTYGFYQSGQMTERYVISVLRDSDATLAEMYFHPTTGPRLDPRGPNPEDLQTLLSPAVRAAVESRPWELCGWPECGDDGALEC